MTTLVILLVLVICDPVVATTADKFITQPRSTLSLRPVAGAKANIRRRSFNVAPEFPLLDTVPQFDSPSRFTVTSSGSPPASPTKSASTFKVIVLRKEPDDHILHLDVSSPWFTLSKLMAPAPNVHQLTLDNARGHTRDLNERIRTILDKMGGIQDVTLIGVPGFHIVPSVVAHDNIQTMRSLLKAPVRGKGALPFPKGHVLGAVWGNDALQLTERSSVRVVVSTRKEQTCTLLAPAVLSYSCHTGRLFISYCQVLLFGTRRRTRTWDLSADYVSFAGAETFLSTYSNVHNVEIRLSSCPLFATHVHLPKHFARNVVYQKDPIDARYIERLHVRMPEIDPDQASIDYAVVESTPSGSEMEIEVSVDGDRIVRSKWTWSKGRFRIADHVAANRVKHQRRYE
ncbi:unnamed protein product (mitochondrion) [Plasmodiophora brassicae]|uniref:Uncharacterized protein n=1 Tax=Plasmodiophora brassicae TaxID=37360 RepID=A0A0G4IVP4_PLABS|nr:hypothetical protein PBRA_001041 [Plasmodiophora brassicae]SPQ97152.1 unnamed protein product [Plasmodiophora brassicae]